QRIERAGPAVGQGIAQLDRPATGAGNRHDGAGTALPAEARRLFRRRPKAQLRQPLPAAAACAGDAVIAAVTVYCSSSNKVAPVFREATTQMGRAIAANGWNLVYGGNAVGMVAVLADACRAAG